MQTMDSRIGLDFIVENPEYIRKLAAALDTNNITVKKQVFELLSALCVYNEEGHSRALDTLDHYKKLKGERYRLSLIVKELDHATIVDYQTALVAFINCLIISTHRLTDRTRLRNEFIGCHLLPVLNNLRKCAEAEPELAVQLDVFDEQRESDDSQSMQGPHGVDLNSPLDVFYAILKQVAETPQEIPFLSILQHLLRIDPKEAVSDIIWDTAERLVHRATLIENRGDAAKLLRTPSVQSSNKVYFCHCQHNNNNRIGDFGTGSNPGSRKQSLITGSQSSIPLLSPPPITSPPPPPPPPPNIPPPPPNIPPAPPAEPPIIPPPPMMKNNTNLNSNLMLNKSNLNKNQKIEKLPQLETPQPKIKMKTINWNKIPSNKVVGRNNIWSQVAYRHQNSPMEDMDWSEMEGLFCQQAQNVGNQSPKLSGNRDSGGFDNERRVRKENSEVTLLDGKRSLNVNIFLKQFRSSNEDIIQLIKDGEHDDIGAEKIKGLLKILPEVDEMDMLKSYVGDFNKLGNAEKFLLQLTSLSNYKLRIESMLIKEEFAANMGYLEPSIESMIAAAKDLMTNKPLQEVLYMILVAGNFLNSGGYAGNAAGVKLSSLQKITDIRANKPNMNLIHFVALQAEKRNKKLLSFTDNTSVLEDAAKTTVEQLQNEINTLDSRIKKIKKQIELPTTEHDIKHQMSEFLMMAEREVEQLQESLIQLENVRIQLTDFFCEDINTFKLEECFRIFHGFYCKFKQAVTENERRRLQEEQANARRRQREELLATKRRQMGLVGSPDSEIIDTQIYDSRSGFQMKKGRKPGSGSNVTSEEEISSIPGSPCLNRKRLGSFNGDNSNSKEEKSPDITPNGSLRRRRSRVLSEEDEGTLMEFLRSSSHHQSNGNDASNRERKSWGSLDRSWARRARGSGPSRKRPTLLSADFSSDRERPSSPSPLAEEAKSDVFDEKNQSTKKEWRQKIESWLQANENDQVVEENINRRQDRRRMITNTNRKSLEIDSESDRSNNTLDTLPEGKQVYTGGQNSYRKVYPDWKPSVAIENADVVGAMEAVEEVQPQVKDKSAWRKSNLNVANSTEETKEDSRFRYHTLPRTRIEITEEEDDDNRKSLIASLGEKPAHDRLTLYIRRPSDTPSNPSEKSNISKHEVDGAQEEMISNKVEIDQDNIETPPAIRKIFTPSPVDKREPIQPSPCRRLLGRSSLPSKESSSLHSPEEIEPKETLGDGQFDRFSATRRTRRFKRQSEINPIETSLTSTSSLQSSSPSSPSSGQTELIAEKEIINVNQMGQIESSIPVNIGKADDRDARLKAWQERLKCQNDVGEVKVHRRSRNQTGINQDDVKMALKFKISAPIDIEPEKRVSKSYLTTDESNAETKNNPTRKTKEDDEGFEENLSLMSESPSQGASSSANYDPDTVSDEKEAVLTSTRESKHNQKGNVIKPKEKLKNIPIKPISNKIEPKRPIFDRNNSLRHSTVVLSQDSKKSVIPRRTNSLRKPDSQSNNIKKNINLSGNKILNEVQRSSSRNSIGSSRTSINSSTSTNTVKKLPLKSGLNNKNFHSGKIQGNLNGNKLMGNNNNNKTSSVVNLKRSSSVNQQKPPMKPFISSSSSNRDFMKPTTSSTTKINNNTNSGGSLGRFGSFRGGKF
ncbi:formin-F [Onthophagus taurus]|uniref:formin-F n=1 Tax=Onthophagus taurus TaxID=166361 RepID=UPI0039BEA73A